MLSLGLDDPGAATAGEATAIFAKAFPTAGTYVVVGPEQRGTELTFDQPPRLAGDPLAIWHEVFTKSGTYLVGAPREFAKATIGPVPERFPEWWLERLVDELRLRTSSVRQVLQRAIEAYLTEFGGMGTAPVALQAFEQLYADLRAGVRFALAEPLPADIEARVRALGFSDTDVLDFAGISYRMGVLDRQLRAAKDWAPTLQTVQTEAIAPADELGIRVARHEVARYLTPVLLKDGSQAQAAALELERQLVQKLTVEAVKLRMSSRELARDLYHQVKDEVGFVRDWERVARTELQRIRLMGAFSAERTRGQWTDDTLVYRIVASNPCNACLRLYIAPDGRPQLYTVAALDAFERQGPNRGPAAEWGPRVGPTHPNCLCSPWYAYRKALEKLWAERAAGWRQVLRERKLPVSEAA